MIPFAPFAWDRSELDPSSSDATENALPTADGYKPMQSLEVFSAALAAECRGAWMARKTDGSIVVLAGTSTNLYRLNNTTWTSIGSGFALATGENWSGVQFGDNFVFANVNATPRVYNLTSGALSTMTGSPPQARIAAVSGDYLILASTAAEPSRFYRSGINNINFWTPKQRGSDFQDLPDGGPIKAVVGHERGAVIFQESAIRVMDDQPGSPLLFTLTKTENTRGAVSSEGVVQVGSEIYFLAEDGFFRFGAPPVPIGAERVDRVFLKGKVDLDEIDQVRGVYDPANQVVMWLYKDTFGRKRFIGYRPALDRWFQADAAEATYLLSAATPGFTLEQIETVLGYTSIDSVPVSLDDRFWRGGRPTLAAFDAANKLGFYSGDNMEALLETNDGALGGEGYKAFVSALRPVGDFEGAYGSVGTKETFGAIRTWTPESSQNVTGLIPVRASGRTARFRVRVPSGAIWNHGIGIEPTMRRLGQR
jgi:hypothetical protein